jgi:hypothetical protein
MTRYAPIAIFIYARPDHLQKMLTDLLGCPEFYESPIFVFGDGPKDASQNDDVQRARTVAQNILGTRANYRFSNVNKGLGPSIIAGVDELTEKFGKVIVIEDDLGLSPNFLAFLNKNLNLYEDDLEVFQISGHNFDCASIAERDIPLAIPMTTTWGWATWRRAWIHFDPECKGWQELNSDLALRKRFNLNGAYDYATMLERQMSGKADSWGIRWYWSVFMRNGLSIFPPKTLINNRGMDGSGSHGRGIFRKYDKSFEYWEPKGHYERVIFDENSYQHLCEAIFKQNGGRLGQFVDKLKSRLR